jgi:hypothetical protein
LARDKPRSGLYLAISSGIFAIVRAERRRAIMSRDAPRLLPISLIVVSDYEPGIKTWADELACVTAIATDPLAVPGQILVMAGRRANAQDEPPDALQAIPNCEIVFTDVNSSVGLKNRGLALCKYDLVAMVEADCLPERAWLSLLYEFMAGHPQSGVVSGRTLYEGNGMLRRVMSLIDRGYLERPNSKGQFEHYSANGALFRRELLVTLPLPEKTNPFIAVHLHHKTLYDNGVTFGVEKRAVLRHAFPSFSFIWDLRRNKGYQFATVLETGGADLLGRARRALNVARRSFSYDWKISRKLFTSYCRKRDVVLWLFLMLYVRLPEMSGAFAAGKQIDHLKSTFYK